MKFAQVLAQSKIPVLIRIGGLLARLPFGQGNKDWLQAGRSRKPKWDAGSKSWTVPAAWFNDLVESCLQRYGAVYIVQPFRSQEKCAPACWSARGHICTCSCMGANHGSGDPGGSWVVVSDAFATKWGAEEIAVRLLATRAE